VAFRADGKLLTSGVNGEVKLWDPVSGLTVLTIQEDHQPPGVVSVAFSPDGKLLAGARGDAVQLWDAATGQHVRTLMGHKPGVRSVAFSPDGKRLASVADRSLKLWDVASGKEIWNAREDAASSFCVAFSPDGRRLASASGKRTMVQLLDAATGQEVGFFKGHTSDLWSVAFSPDGQRLASASGDRTVKIWDTAAAQGVLTLKGTKGRVAAFRPDGALAIAERNTVKLCDAASGQEVLTLVKEPDNNHFVAIAFSSDGRRLAGITFTDRSEPLTVKVWDVATSQEIAVFQVYSGKVGPVTFWTVALGTVAFSADGKRLACNAEENGLAVARVSDVDSGQQVRTFKVSTNWVNSVAFSPDGKRLASASGGTGPYAFFRAEGEERLGAPAGVGREEVKLWDLTTGQGLTLKGHTDAVNSVVYSPDGKRLASASWDKTVKVWDAASGQEIMTLKGHTFNVVSVAFSPNGKRLASASWDNTVNVWDAASGQEVMTLRGHSAGVGSVAFSPDGKRLVSAAADGTILIWDALKSMMQEGQK
jgi:WD40 repeat protein